MLYKNCPFCGIKYEETDKDAISDYPNSLRCSSCKKIFYNNPKPAAAGLVVSNNKIILVKRRYEPYKDYWDLPGGFLNYGESPKEALKRELKEELNIDISSSEIIGAFNIFYPFEKAEKLSLVVLVFRVNFNSLDVIKANDDVKEYSFFDGESLPINIAFPEQKIYLKNIFKSFLTK